MALATKTYSLLTKSAIPQLFKRYGVKADAEEYYAAAQVFPMRVNSHVVEDLIDWANAPDDPLFHLAFPQPEMLSRSDRHRLIAAAKSNLPRPLVQRLAEDIRRKMNPHPANQKSENVPHLQEEEVPGMQHKYKETVLFFPAEGQYCHAFCTYCFRWAQFTSVGSDQTFKSNNAQQLCKYIASQPQVRDVLFTGGDPMVMNSKALGSYIEPLIAKDGPSHLETIRIGSKSLAWWPYKYTSDPDAKQTLAVMEQVVKSGRQLAFQAHFSHPRELEHPAAQEAVRQIRMTGAQIRGQAPLIQHVNDSASVWQHMWNLQTRLGITPYYMFVERDTGASHYFRVPLARAYVIFSEAYAGLAGTARTVRGPSMSASPGKARDPSWTQRVFFAKFDAEASWLSDLRPAFGEKEFFYEERYRDIVAQAQQGSSGQISDD